MSIKVRLNPKVLTNEGQIQKDFDFIHGRNVYYYADKIGVEIDIEVRYIRNGAVAEGHDIVVDGDEIIIVPNIADPITQFFAAVFASAIFQTIVVIATIASIGFAIYSAASARKPSYGSAGNGGIDNGSPTYGWDGIQNTSDVAIPIAIIYGEHRVGGNIIGRYVRTDGDLNYLNMLIALGEGEIDSVTDLMVNGNPIANFDSVSYETKLGTNAQTPISNFNQVHDTRSVGVNLLYASAHTYTSFGSLLNAIDIHLSFPNGLFQQDQNTGVLSAWTVTYKVEYKVHSSGSWTDLGNVSVSAMSRSAVRRVYRIEGLTAEQYDVRLTRQTANSDFYHTGDLAWDTTDEIVNEDLAYPNTALLSVTALATDQLSGTEPTITSVVKGIKVSQPRVMNGGAEVAWADYYYDSDTSQYKLLSDGTVLSWDGTTYVTKWSANPVWCLMDLLLNTRYGLGSFIDTAMIDLPSFVSMSQYCENRLPDGIGGYEKRFRLDIVLDASTKSIDMIFQVASSFRGLLFYSAGTIKLKIDRPETPVQLFGMGNIQKGGFSQSWISLKQRYNIIEVQFLNKDLDYLQDMVAVVDEEALANGDPIRKKQIKVFTTSMSQAVREGRFILWVNKYLKKMVSIKAGIDAVVCEPGDVINVSHDVPAWGNSGRVQDGGSTTVVNLDQSVTLQSGITYKIMVRFSDDTIEERTVITAPGTVSQVTVSSVFTQTPQAFDVYAIGESSIETKPFRVLNMQVDSDYNVEISALEYNESIYDDSAPALPTINYSALSMDVPYVSNLQLTSGVVKLADGTIQSTIDVWFTKPDSTSVYVMYRKAKIYLSDNGGLSWDYQGETYGNTYQINKGLIDGTTYKVAVVGVGGNDVAGQIALSPQATIVSVGKSAVPSDVPSFLVNQNRDRIYFGWGEVTDVDLSAYEIRFGDAWETGTVLATQIKHSTYTDINPSTGSSQKFFIKAIDTSGNYSENATQATLTIDQIPFQNIIQEFMEAASWAGTLSSTVIVSSTLQLSTTFLTGTYVTPVRDIGFVATFKIFIQTTVVDASGDRAFDDDSTSGFDTDPLARFSGQEVSGALSFRIKTSEDNITWSAWSAYQPGDYKCRYFQLELTVVRQSSAQQIEVTQFDYYADLPDVDEFSDTKTISVAASGLAVTFDKIFHQVPSVAITILSGSGVYAQFSSAPDTSGFTVKLFNAAGTAQTGTFSYHAHGV